MATNVVAEETIPREPHTSFSGSSGRGVPTPEPEEPRDTNGTETTASEHMAIRVEKDDVQGIPETESITMDAPLRSSIDISMDEARDRDRQMSASLTDRTRTSSKNLFVKQESMTQISTTSTASDTQTGTNSSAFPEMTATSTSEPQTPHSDSESKPPHTNVKIEVEEKQVRRKESTRTSRVTSTARASTGSPERVQREVYRKYRNTIRRTRKSHRVTVAGVVYFGLLLFLLAVGLSCVSLAKGILDAHASLMGIIFAVTVADFVLSLVAELSLFVRGCFRYRGDATFNPQLYFCFQIVRRPIVMGGLAVFWWFHLQNTPKNGWTVSGRVIYGMMVFLIVWEAFLLYMQWDEHAVYILLQSYDLVCGGGLDDSNDSTDEPEGMDYEEFETESAMSPRFHEVPIRMDLEYHASIQSNDGDSVRSSGTDIGPQHKTNDSGDVSRSVSPSNSIKLSQSKPNKPKPKTKSDRLKTVESIPSQSADDRGHGKERRHKNRDKPKRRKADKSVRSRINETGQVMLVSTGNKYLDEDYGQIEMSVSLSSRSDKNHRQGKWKAPPRRKKPSSQEEKEELGDWQSQRTADRNRHKRQSGSRERRSHSPRRRRGEDELQYRKKDSVITIVGGQSSRSKSPRSGRSSRR